MRIIVKGLLAAAAVAAIAAPVAMATAGTVTPKLVGGVNATETYTFMAALSSSEGWGCGASLIRPTWIATAKHCVSDGGVVSPPSTLSFRIGTLQQGSGGVTAKAKRVIAHANTDFAIVELTAPVSMKPVRIASSAPINGATRLIGWGCRTDACNTPNDGTLQQLDTSILPDSACSADQYILCINNPDGWRGACYGDSGGPAVIKVGTEWQLVGATSGGTGKCGENPSFYVDVPFLKTWIEGYAGPDGGGGPTDPPGNGTNLALNKPTKSKQASCAAAEAPAKAVNGSVSGGNSDKWCSAVAGAKALEVDLGSNKALKKFVVQHAGAGGESTAFNTKNFVIETSTGGGVWSTAATITNNTASTTTSTVSVSARWIRITTTDAVARIYEFEAY